MQKINWILGLGLISLTTTLAAAETDGQPSRFDAADSDGDGQLSFAEFEAAGEGSLARMDSDNNEVISLDEFLNARPARQPRGPAARQATDDQIAERREHMLARATETFYEMDLDGDELLSQSELAQASFLRMDRDGNGLLSKREMRAQRRGAPGMARRGGGRGPGDAGQSPQD